VRLDHVQQQLTRFMLRGPHRTVGFASFWDLSAIGTAVGKPAFPVQTIMAVPADAFVLPTGLSEEVMPPRPD
jgi:hypothetical protein